MIKRIILFLILNFTALGIGGQFTSAGVASLWYQNLDKAPWTPPGWMFGAAWTFIMICFAIYMAYLLKENAHSKKIIGLYAIQWILNTAWNPVFFYSRSVWGGLVCISILTILIAYFFFTYLREMKIRSIFVAPYLIWLILATSLNAYILIYN